MKILFPLRSFRHPQYRTRLASEAQVARGRAFTMPRAVMTAMSSCLITIFTFERVLDAMFQTIQNKQNKIEPNPPVSCLRGRQSSPHQPNFRKC